VLLIWKEKLHWEPPVDKTFLNLEIVFKTPPILIRPDFSKYVSIEADALDLILRLVLLQMGDDKKLHSIAFYSKKIQSQNSITIFMTKTSFLL